MERYKHKIKTVKAKVKKNKITDKIKYAGVYDTQIDLFESQYPIPDGITYNSYVILDEKVAVLDTAERDFFDDWIKNVELHLDGRRADYLIVHHMEPDHSANIKRFIERFPSAKIIATEKAFDMMENFFGKDLSKNGIIASSGDKLSLGEHTLLFITAPMVHWPEVMVSYEGRTKTLFSADAFGTFGKAKITDDWRDEARRYYIGIVGKYGRQVRSLLSKIRNLDIMRICPLHGPVISENIEHYVNLYDTWASYRYEERGVLIAYTSIYGNTREGALLLRDELCRLGCKTAIYDLARCDMSRAISDAFRYSALVLAATTYNADIFPPMRMFIHGLCERNFGSRTVGIIENGSWAPTAGRVILNILSKCDNLTFAKNYVRVASALSDKNKSEIKALAKELSEI